MASCRSIVWCMNSFCPSIETAVMPDSQHSSTIPAALPFVYPLDDFYARAGIPLPKFERISGEEVPEPYKSLLVHEKDMTPTLEEFHHGGIHLKILRAERRDDFYFRQVALHQIGRASCRERV